MRVSCFCFRLSSDNREGVHPANAPDAGVSLHGLKQKQNEEK